MSVGWGCSQEWNRGSLGSEKEVTREMLVKPGRPGDGRP